MNGHADVTALLDATTGNTVATYYYDAFGTITEETGTVNNPFRYSGYQYDEETELYYLNARMYDSKIARFLQEDTYRGQANDPLSLNLYAYCRNNPLIYWDPTGHMESDVTINGKKIGNAQVSDGVTTGNIRDIATALGGEVGYDHKNKIASVTLNGQRIEYDLKTVKNGVGIDSMGNPFYTTEDGHLKASVRDMAKIADVEESIDWGMENNTPYVTINTPEPSTSGSSNSYVPPVEEPSEPDYQPSKPTNDAGNNSNSSNQGAGNDDTVIEDYIDSLDRDLDSYLKEKTSGRMGSTELGALLLMMTKVKYGKYEFYHANYNCWQEWFGYNDFYDLIFSTGSDMDKAKFKFNYEGEDLIIWAWKGDYLNLGAGAELGIYKRYKIGNIIPTPHWEVDKSLSLPMTLQLSYNGDTIIYYRPSEDQWWITGFNPEFKDVKADELTATFTIDFSQKKDMYDAFIKSRDYLDNMDAWTISKTNKYLMKLDLK